VSAEQDVLEIWTDLGKQRVLPAGMFANLSKMEALRARKALRITTFQQDGRWFWEFDRLLDDEVAEVEEPAPSDNASILKANLEAERYGTNFKPSGLPFSDPADWVTTRGRQVDPDRPRNGYVVGPDGRNYPTTFRGDD